MDFIWRGRLLQIFNLTPKLNELFLKLYAAFESGPPCDLEAFREAVAGFLDAFPRATQLHDEYFGNFGLVWHPLLQARQFDRADALWEIALQPVYQWEFEHAPQRIHKGTPFYFLGMAAILSGDIDKGYAWMHRALEEDIRSHGGVRVHTPAFNFVTMNATTDQAFRPWVTTQITFLDEHLKHYRTALGRGLTMTTFEQRFLSSPPTIDSVFLFDLPGFFGPVITGERRPSAAL